MPRYNGGVYFYSQDTNFIQNLSDHYELFEVYDNGDECEIWVEPKNEKDLRNLCDILVKYSDNYVHMSKLTGDFLEYGDLYDHFRELFGQEDGNKIVDDAIAYTRSLFQS